MSAFTGINTDETQSAKSAFGASLTAYSMNETLAEWEPLVEPWPLSVSAVAETVPSAVTNIEVGGECKNAHRNAPSCHCRFLVVSPSDAGRVSPARLRDAQHQHHPEADRDAEAGGGKVGGARGGRGVRAVQLSDGEKKGTAVEQESLPFLEMLLSFNRPTGS